MDHQQWLEWRREGIGSSDAPIIMGVSPWATIRECWEEKVYGNKEKRESPSMTRGKALEESARRYFEDLVDTVVFPRNVEHPEFSWLRASLDGIDIEGKILVEIKCPNQEDHKMALKNQIPSKYYPQLQHQLFVTGLPSMYYFSFDGKEGVAVQVERNEEYIEELFDKESSFWDLVKSKIPPDLSESDFMEIGNEVWQYLCLEWEEITEKIKSLEESKCSIKRKLEDISDNRNAKGFGFSLTKSIIPGRVDYEKAMQEYLENMRAHYPHINFPDISFEQYRKKSFTKLLIKNINKKNPS